MALRRNKYRAKVNAYNWADLPCDIIVSIFKHLDDYLIDLRRAASVCVAWRRAAGSLLNSKKPSIIKLPFICTCRGHNGLTTCVCRHGNYNSELKTNLLCFFISPASLISRTKTRAWLILVEENGTNRWLLRHRPRSGLEYNFNLLEHKIFGVAVLHILNIANDRNSSMPCVRKVISMSDLGMLLVMFGDKGKLALWSQDSHQWSYINTRHYKFHDIINLRDELYAIDTIGRLVMINPTTLDVVQVASHPRRTAFKYDVSTIYLVCSDGFLYLLRVYANFTQKKNWLGLPRREVKDVGVLMFDKQTRAWVRVENLGNKVFFITKYATFSVTAKQLGLSQGSFICFMCYNFGKAPIIYKVEGNVCRKEQELHSEIRIDLGPPPKWIRSMLHSSKQRKSRKSKIKKGRKGNRTTSFEFWSIRAAAIWANRLTDLSSQSMA